MTTADLHYLCNSLVWSLFWFCFGYLVLALTSGPKGML